ncbi:MAG: hypothetical protein L6461_19250 [Anaerolineae bacterium]|nr:hypothetical protein [Anaerolineae bacterium]
MKNEQECSFCSNPATTREHIIPKWLQNHYGLYDLKLGVWTGNFVNYRAAVVPACKYCNGVRLANLENRVSQGKATECDYYLWALKIRYSLAIMDSRLFIDPKYPEKGFLLSPDMKKYKAEFILPALASLDVPDFKFEPDPFGSVFLFEQKHENKEYFGFADVPPPDWGLSIVLPPNKILVVLFADRGVVKSLLYKSGDIRQLSKMAKALDNNIPQRLLFHLIRIQYWLRIPSGIETISENEIISCPVPELILTKIPKLEWYEATCNHLKISTDVAKKAYEMDREMASKRFVSWRK